MNSVARKLGIVFWTWLLELERGKSLVRRLEPKGKSGLAQ